MNSDYTNLGIYADFNGLDNCSRNPRLKILSLTGYGTFASLNFHQIRLVQGQLFTFTDMESLSVAGEVFFDESRVADDCTGWFAKVDTGLFVSADRSNYDFTKFLCFNCHQDNRTYLDQNGRQYKEKCQFCGTSLMVAMSPPEE